MISQEMMEQFARLEYEKWKAKNGCNEDKKQGFKDGFVEAFAIIFQILKMK